VVAKLIYAVLALALGSLVAGFLVRSSAVPLLASIVLSAVVVVLILVGHSRRLRHPELAAEEEEASLEIVELDDDTEIATQRRTRRPRVSSPAAPISSGAATQAIDVTEEPDLEAAPRRPARKPAAKGTANRTRSRTQPKGPRVLVIPGRSRFHTAACRFAKGPGVREVSETTARRRGYEPCSVCMPGS
jgi:hypothetical protein